jgi:predicted ATP-dependent endonuclease of OLD family
MSFLKKYDQRNKFVSIFTKKMKTLYIDNYKGFTKTFIPFLDVNFFVGENSTGKTAILNLLKVLSEPHFWFFPDFNIGNVELGYFNEIVNQFSENKTFFSIGIEFRDKRSKNSPKFFLMKFKNKNSIPSIFEYMAIVGNKSILVSLSGKSIHYQAIDYNGESFVEWINISVKFNTIKKKINLPQNFKKMPLGLIRYMVEAEIKGKKEIDSVNGIIITPIFNNFIWLAPIRAKAKRTYDAFKQSFSPEGEHIPILLRNLLSAKGKSKNVNLINSLIKFGKESSLFDDIQIDEFSRIKGAPFAINILYNSLPIKITNVGYGISQVIPLIVEILTSKGDTFAIQQPEVHLHPKAQSAFGEFVYHSSVENKNRFIIETHSDYTINRFRYNLLAELNS